MKKPAFCIRENKAVDQLCSNSAIDQRLCFCYIESTMPLLISSILPSSVVVQTGLCWNWLKTPKTGFLVQGFF